MMVPLNTNRIASLDALAGAIAADASNDDDAHLAAIGVELGNRLQDELDAVLDLLRGPGASTGGSPA